MLFVCPLATLRLRLYWRIYSARSLAGNHRSLSYSAPTQRSLVTLPA